MGKKTAEVVQMVALRKTYYGRDIKEGELFQAAIEHVNLLTKTKAARVVDGAATLEPKQKNKYKTRMLEAEK